jgi:hypothetical protein
VVFLNWSFNSRHVILIFPFIVHGPHLDCLLSSTSVSICKAQLAQYLVGVEKVTSISRMKFSRGMLEESISHALFDSHRRRPADHDGATFSF